MKYRFNRCHYHFYGDNDVVEEVKDGHELKLWINALRPASIERIE